MVALVYLRTLGAPCGTKQQPEEYFQLFHVCCVCISSFPRGCTCWNRKDDESRQGHHGRCKDFGMMSMFVDGKK